MADLPVVTKLPEFEDRIGSTWRQEYDANGRMCYMFEYKGCAYRAYPLSGIDKEYVMRIQRC